MNSTTASVESRAPVPGGEVWYRRVGDGQGLPLLVVHGGPGGSSRYLEPLEVLGNEREVVFYDQLGCGFSDNPSDSSLWEIERFVEELGAVINHLGLGRYHVLGHSWGTMLAAELAFQRPKGLASLILAGASLSIPRWIADTAALRAKLPDSVRQALDRHEAAGTTSSEEYGAAVESFYKTYFCRVTPWPDALIRSMQTQNAEMYGHMGGANEFVITGTLASYDCTDRLKEIQVPTRYLCGRYDEATPSATRWYSELTPGSSYRVFEGSSHMAHLEEPDAFRDELEAFLRRVEQSRPG